MRHKHLELPSKVGCHMLILRRRSRVALNLLEGLQGVIRRKLVVINTHPRRAMKLRSCSIVRRGRFRRLYSRL